MKQQTYVSVVTVVFVLVAALHLFRVAFQWDAVVGGRVIPLWMSVVALVISAYLAYEGFRHTKS